MAESVDALVSNTSRFTPVPVRPRLWVQNRLTAMLGGFLIKISINPYKGQAGDLNIRYHSERAKCLESNREGGVCNDHCTSKGRREHRARD